MTLGSDIEDIVDNIDPHTKEKYKKARKRADPIWVIDGMDDSLMKEDSIEKPPAQCAHPLERRDGLSTLDGRCLDLIAAFVGERVPTFIFSNWIVFKEFVNY